MANKGDDKSEKENESESKAMTDYIIEEDSESEGIDQDSEESNEYIPPLEVEDQIFETEVVNKMSNAPLSDYTPITEPDQYSIDDYGSFLLQLDGEAASLALN